MVTVDLVWHCFGCEIVCCRLEKIDQDFKSNMNMYAESTEKRFIEKKKWNEKRKILPFSQDNILGGEFMTLSNISNGTFSVKKLMGKSSIIDLWKGNICTSEPWRTWIAYWCKPRESH